MLVGDDKDRLLCNDDTVGVVVDPTMILFLLCLCGLLGSDLGRRRVALDAFIVLNSAPRKMKDQWEGVNGRRSGVWRVMLLRTTSW